MKRSIFAAVAGLLVSTAAAQCNAPRVALGDERDDNPVVGVEIKYKAEDHAWRIFHRLRNGLVVARALRRSPNVEDRRDIVETMPPAPMPPPVSAPLSVPMDTSPPRSTPLAQDVGVDDLDRQIGLNFMKQKLSR